MIGQLQKELGIERVRPVMMFRRLFVFLAFVLPLLLPVAGQAQELHELFEERCGRCHEHAGPFARESLIVTDGQVMGRASGQEVGLFLLGHYGRLTENEIEALRDLFRFQIISSGLYEKRCLNCHESAKTLARSRLLVREDRLVGRYTGRDMAEFLARHGRLSGSEAIFMTEVLRWQIEGGALPERFPEE
jgi:hypothetical protein